MSAMPFVSVIIPSLNAEKTIRACIESLVTQTYPADRYEIILVDGCSCDATVAIANEYASQRPQLRILENPGGRIPRSLNMGLHAARGEIIARMDAHSVAQPDYLAVCVDILLQGAVDHVGGYLKALGNGYWGKVIALATTCSFGVGNAHFRLCNSRDVDAAGFPGAFWKETLLKLNGWDESFAINEDDELSFRMKRLGYALRTTSRIVTKYFCRNSLSALARQYFRYGYWKAKVMLKHHGPESLRHVAPAFFVLFLLLGLPAAFLHPIALIVAGAVGGTYALLSACFAFRAAQGSSPAFIPAIPFAFLTLHLSYGAGLLLGLPRFVFGKQAQR